MDPGGSDSHRTAGGFARYLIIGLILGIAGIVICGEMGGRVAPVRQESHVSPQGNTSSVPRGIPAPPGPQNPAGPLDPSPPRPAEPASPSPGAEEVFARVAPGVVVVEAYDPGGRPVAQGSGVVVSRGYVVTNRHVVERASEIRVRQRGRSYAARVQHADRELDLCGLSVADLSADPVSVASVSDLRVGQRVYAVGAPQGLELSLSEGVVSSLRIAPGGIHFIQTTAAVSKGSSGGGLFDARGRLVGITTFVIQEGQNLNFALPAEMIAGLPARSADIRALPPVGSRPGEVAPEPSAEASRTRELREAISRKRNELIELEKEVVRMKSEMDQAVLTVQQMQTAMTKHRMANNTAAYNGMVPDFNARVEDLKDMERRYKERRLEYLDRAEALNRMVAEYNALPH